MGARIKGRLRANEPIFSIRYFIWNIQRGQTTENTQVNRLKVEGFSVITEKHWHLR
jgi:hypothetical protein